MWAVWGRDKPPVFALTARRRRPVGGVYARYGRLSSSPPRFPPGGLVTLLGRAALNV